MVADLGNYNRETKRYDHHRHQMDDAEAVNGLVRALTARAVQDLQGKMCFPAADQDVLEIIEYLETITTVAEHCPISGIKPVLVKKYVVRIKNHFSRPAQVYSGGLTVRPTPPINP